MAGIYLHIPFCKQACTYCNFHFSTSLQYKDELVQALLKEMKAEKHYLGNEQVETIYFGGGTPSLLSIDDVRLILNTIRQNFSVASTAEITLEANPDDITKTKLRGWQGSGINRLSIGVQSFYEEELRWMNRAHNSQQAINSLLLAVEAFKNITLDLIYGSPLLTDDMWQSNVEKAISLGISHLSCYALTVEEKTPLHKYISQKKSLDVDSDKQARQFLLLMKWLGDAGYEHYEVSNFAKPGFRSRHNSSYWKGSNYLGFGPSAHSFNGRERRWNVANNNIYIKNMNDAVLHREAETLSATQQLNEIIMISLRTMEGIDLQKIENGWGRKERVRLENDLTKYINNNLILIQQQQAKLTQQGMLRADGIAADLFAG